MPFEQAVELFEDFMGIHVSKDVGQRYTEEAGAVYEELQTEEVEAGVDQDRSLGIDPHGKACQ